MAVAVGEVLQVRRVPAAGEHERKRLLYVVGMDELVHGTRHQLLAAPAQRLLPRGVEQGEAAVQRDGREQVARQLEQPRDARRLLGAARAV